MRKILEKLKEYGRILSSQDLIDIGLYHTMEEVKQERRYGTGPATVQQGNRVMYRKKDVIEWIIHNPFLV